jgi:hypothetical protein
MSGDKRSKVSEKKTGFAFQTPEKFDEEKDVVWEEWMEQILDAMGDEPTFGVTVTTDYFELDPKRNKGSDLDFSGQVLLLLGKYRLYLFRSSDPKKVAKLAIHYLDIMQIVSVRPSEVTF